MILRFPIELTRPPVNLEEAQIACIERMAQRFIDGLTGDVEKDGCTVSDADNFDARR